MSSSSLVSGLRPTGATSTSRSIEPGRIVGSSTAANSPIENTPRAVWLGESAAQRRYEAVPAAVVGKAKAFVNHAVTVGLVVAGHERSAAARRAVLEHERLGPRQLGAGQGATLWMDGARVTRAGAAFANGVAGGGDKPRGFHPNPPPPRGPHLPAG